MKHTLPTVTHILADNNMYPDWSHFPQAELEAKAKLGTVVHRLCAGAAKGKWFDNDTPADAYVRQYVKWLKDSGAKVLRTEFTIRATVAGLKYIGHADLELEWNREKWIVDIKTGATYPAHPVQLAGYAAGISKHHRRGILQITPKSARMIPIIDTGWADKRWEACCLLSKMRGIDHANDTEVLEAFAHYRQDKQAIMDMPAAMDKLVTALADAYCAIHDLKETLEDSKNPLDIE